MTPFTLITTHQAAERRTSEVAGLLARYERRLQEHEPGLLTFSAHVDDDGGRVALLHLFADAEAAERHIRLVANLLDEARDLVRNLRIEVYGAPGPNLREAIDRNAAAGVTTVVQSRPVAGFTRVAR
ncbi:MAG TPA: antibiotic biosynthesis monooxygenase [Marmoricola sp.]|jgi:quinol monooxygenase YgiN|nr:antibiotic biosynthesis monooxygenase [Marmoricola sp.]